jgi:hypothetical protein
MSDTTVSTIHLCARGCSRRAVRYRVLGPDMISHIESQVSHAIAEKATQYDFSHAVVTMALEQMILEISEPDVTSARYKGQPEKPGDPAPKPIEFQTVGADLLHQVWKSYFNAKDTAILTRVYSQEHTVSSDELDEVMAGKVTTAPA